ncbi:MAG: DUF3465 domain-containing protein [Xanthomonadales bacterium]|nr:DUF3465 domain-containing protein [Xanthomonadales bacterium]
MRRRPTRITAGIDPRTRNFLVLLVIGAIILAVDHFGLTERYGAPKPGAGPATETAFEQGISGRQVLGSGEVIRILPDDNDGSRHQRFILRTASGQTLLIAHNIDLAPRISDLRKGDRVEFHGVYEWNDRGGVIHWTHHDPRGEHTPGWLKHEGRTYQ